MSAAPALRVAAPAVAPRLAALLAFTSPAPLQTAMEDVAPKFQQPKPLKSFKLHIGGEITLPTRFQAPSSPPCSSTSSSTTSANDVAAAAAAEAPRLHDPFEGVPLRAWAERLGERVMPAYEAVKAEEARRKAEALAAKGNSGGASSAASAVVAAPLSVPSVFPLTRWAASSPAVRSTLVAADDPKERPKARLSWYHPDDTMVPRDWFKGGLLKDLEYYRPFRSPVKAPEPALA